MTSATPIQPRPNAWRRDLLVDEKRHPKRSTFNVVLMLTRAPEWRDVLVFDLFAERIATRRSPPWHTEDIAAGPWTEQDDVRLIAHVERELGFSLKPGEVRGAVENVARRSSVNPLVEWLDALKWDGTARVDAWLTSYLGVPQSDYASRVGRWFLLGAVARALAPGCKVDHVLVLEGPQGKRKSSALRVLAGETFFNDTPLEMGSKDRFIAIQGTWIQEIAELDGFERADVNRVKSYVTSAVDTYRPPYGRAPVKFPRRCVFAATVNGDEYLRDTTGNRRFWPVRVLAVDLDGLERDREQLWAEALHRYRSREPWWPANDEEVAACATEQGTRIALDAWQDRVASHVTDLHSVTVAEILSSALGIQIGKWTQSDQNRAARCLRSMGWERKQVREAGRHVWVYLRPEQGPNSAEECNQLADVTS